MTRPNEIGEREGDFQQNEFDKKIALRTFKVIIIGDSNVGKTCLTVRAAGGTFPIRTEATIGVDFKEKIVQVGKENIKLQLWDSAGQERFRHSMVPHYYRNVHGVIFVYDVTRKASFVNIEKWIEEFRCNVVKNCSKIPQLIIGNKCDLHADRQVSETDVKILANNYGLPFWETSAKSELETDTIETIFQSLGETLFYNTPLKDFPPHFSSTIQQQHHAGLRVNQSLSFSSEENQNVKNKRKSRLSKKKKNIELESNEGPKGGCCKTG